MAHALIQHVQKRFLRNHPEIKPGYTVKVFQNIKEGSKERTQIFEGLVIAVSHGAGTDKTFTVRKVTNGFGVERVFPFHSASLSKIEVLKKAKIRRAKLYYMRNLSGKAARLKEQPLNMVGDMSLVHQEVEAPAMAEEVVETVETNETPEVVAEETAMEDAATEEQQA
ncbi:50S ribosomal protein L19 [Candidatus Gracilibacteria bacterium]|nr:50S ribosomal protein L19 [Candidatus Gracilibacteria bacterium]